MAMPPLDDVLAEVEVAGHLDGGAEGNFAVLLREVDVDHRESAAVDVDGKIDLGLLGEVLDVAIAAVLAGRDGAGGFHGGP